MSSSRTYKVGLHLPEAERIVGWQETAALVDTIAAIRDRGITVLLMTTSISLLYNAGDPHARRFRVFTPGAILALLLTILLSQALAFFFREKATNHCNHLL
mgnify:CR=1 FL=1